MGDTCEGVRVCVDCTILRQGLQAYSENAFLGMDQRSVEQL